MLSTIDFARIERAIHYLDEHVAEQPGLTDVAARIGMSEFHFQRLFRRWAGVSPKRFLQFATATTAADQLLGGASTLDATYAAGLSSPSRLHDLTIAVHALTPGELKSDGEGLTIGWALHPTPFGPCFIAATQRGICEMAFVDPAETPERLADLARRWPAAAMQEDREGTERLVVRIFGAQPDPDVPITVLLRGTNFQLQVWRALLEVPPGRVTTYGEVARSIGAPKSARAVGTAIGSNRIAYLIPCHRVIRGTAAFGNYRWGPGRKRAILAWERSLAAS